MIRPTNEAPARPQSHAEERYLSYKSELHQKLIASMDLSVLGKSDPEELRARSAARPRSSAARAPTCSTWPSASG